MTDSDTHRQAGCPFCALPRERIVEENELGVAIRDARPITPGHTLVITHRHVSDYFGLTPSERNALERLLHSCRESLMAADASINGFNVGVNCGESAGQKVFHVHIHLIPRRTGDNKHGIRRRLSGADHG